MQKEEAEGSLLGGILLIAGCCIGAGMLGLPVLSAFAGFVPSVAMFLLCWVYMVATGFLLLEVNLWFRDEAGIISMAERTLGFVGKILAGSLFLLLFYAILAAYVSGCGVLISDFFQVIFGRELPYWVGSSLTCLALGLVLYAGTKIVDDVNRLLMLGLIGTFLFLIMIGLTHVNPIYLMQSDWSATLLVVPLTITSFGFHNLVPSLSRYLKHDTAHLRLSIIVGTAIPLLIYLLWEFVILGLVPAERFHEAYHQEQMATRALRDAVGGRWVVVVTEYYAFFAIVTSLLAVGLSFVDFLEDGLRMEWTPRNRFLLCALTLLPPFSSAIFYPTLFLYALRYGGLITVVLFGLLPCAMVWNGRYIKKLGQRELVPGGRISLVILMVISIFLILFEGVRG